MKNCISFSLVLMFCVLISTSNSKASEKQPLTGSALHGCRTPNARMFALFSKDMEILCDNINYSQSQWRCSLFHIYRAHQFSAVSRVTGRNFSSKCWTWAIIQRDLKNHPWRATAFVCTACDSVPLLRYCTRTVALWTIRLSLAVIGVPSHATAVLYCRAILRKYTKGEFTLIWSTE